MNQQNGVHTCLADLANSMPFDSVPHYQDYISRLHQIPRVLDQVTEVMRQGLKDGLMPPKLVLEKLPGQCDGVIAANPFLIPTKKFPADFSDADKKRLTDEITKAVNDDVVPAYKKFAEFLRTDYDPKGRTEISIESLPDGKQRYAEAVKMMTTTNVPPAEIHEIGLKEVERITAEMTKLAQAQGKRPSPASANQSTTTRSGNRPVNSRSWMTSRNTSIRWSRSYPSYSACCPKGRLR